MNDFRRQIFWENQEFQLKKVLTLGSLYGKIKARKFFVF